MARSPLAGSAALAHAHALLDRFPLIDGHNDLPFVIHRSTKGDVEAFDLERVHPETDTDIPRLKQGRVGVQVLAAFVPNTWAHPVRTYVRLLDIILEIERRHADVFFPIRRSGDVALARKAGKIGSLIGIESGIAIVDDMSVLRVFYAAGARLMTLCHNETLDWVDSATDVSRVEKGGLSGFGERIIAEMNRLGMIVDLAHVAPHAQHRVLDVTKAPVVWSHSNAKTLSDHPRNVPDDVLDRVRPNGGVVMATFVPEFISQRSWDWEKPAKPLGKFVGQGSREGFDVERTRSHGPQPRATLSQYLDHVDYLVKRCGIAHVGIGSDFYGGATPQGLDDASCFPGLIAGLVERGYSDTAIKAIMGGNFLRVFRKVEALAAG